MFVSTYAKSPGDSATSAAVEFSRKDQDLATETSHSCMFYRRPAVPSLKEEEE